MMNFEIVVAMDQKMGIGNAGELPWHLPADLKHFKNVTCEGSTEQKPNVVIMGRKTWESIPAKFRPLPNRLNLVLTRQPDYPLPEGVEKAGSLKRAEEILQAIKHTKVFIIGGAELFCKTLGQPQCNALHITHIDHEFPCDTYFPSIPKDFIPQDKPVWQTESGLKFSFQTYSKQS